MPHQRFRWIVPPEGELWSVRGTLTGVQLLTLSFLALILLGSLGFLLLPGLYTGARPSILDAVFTATSAVCVTGLTVMSTAEDFTLLGQAWLALLIQLGGLGILTLATQIIAVLGRRSSLTMDQALGSQTGLLGSLDTRQIVRSVVVFTLVTEGVGAVLLWLLWKAGLGSWGAVWPAVFHAISAFCNAGFSIFTDSLSRFESDPATLTVVAAMIILGGVGFIVIDDLRLRYVKRATRRLRVHTKLVISATGVLLVFGGALYLACEWTNTLAHLAWPERVMNAAFMSVTARTAGFNTVDYGALSNAAAFLTIGLMLVGGSPGSTAGGVKTTTFAILTLLLLSRLRGLGNVSIMRRTVPQETVSRATSLAVSTGALMGAAILILLMAELPLHLVDRSHFVELVFEAQSAFGTVGLSMGTTAELTAGAKWVLVFLMFLGRVGPLTLVAAMASAGGLRPKYRYAHEDVAIG